MSDASKAFNPEEVVARFETELANATTADELIAVQNKQIVELHQLDSEQIDEVPKVIVERLIELGLGEMETFQSDDSQAQRLISLLFVGYGVGLFKINFR